MRGASDRARRTKRVSVRAARSSALGVMRPSASSPAPMRQLSPSRSSGSSRPSGRRSTTSRRIEFVPTSIAAKRAGSDGRRGGALPSGSPARIRMGASPVRPRTKAGPAGRRGARSKRANAASAAHPRLSLLRPRPLSGPRAASTLAQHGHDRRISFPAATARADRRSDRRRALRSQQASSASHAPVRARRISSAFSPISSRRSSSPTATRRIARARSSTGCTRSASAIRSR